MVKVKTNHSCVFHFINDPFLLYGGVAASFHTVCLTSASSDLGRIRSFAISRANGKVVPKAEVTWPTRWLTSLDERA
jgi:hypothetical protein